MLKIRACSGELSLCSSMIIATLFVACASPTPKTATGESGYPGHTWNSGLFAGKDILPTLPAGAHDAILIQSNRTDSWAVKPVIVVDATSGTSDIQIEATATRQTMTGYGGAFNEKGWAALSVLSENQRSAVLAALFSAERGIGFNDCRIPIGASDYALSRYSLDDTVDDWSLEHFSIDRDREALIPYIKAAQAINPSMRFWASYWSPPAWLKDNGKSDSGALRNETRVYETLARYDIKFLQAYAAEGIPVSRIAVQNEPTILTNYPSCAWTPEQFRIFVGTHLGPLLKKEAPETGLLLGTFNDPRNSEWIRAVMSDSNAAQYVSCIGLQWDGNQGLPSVANLIKGIPLIQTETDCGNWHWKPGFNAYFPQNDFEYGAYTWNKIRNYLETGVVVYDLWNMILDETGHSIDSKMPWPQNSAIVIDTTINGGAVHLTPMFYAIGHFSRYAGPGSVRIGSTGFAETVAFKRPDGSISVQLLNTRDSARKFTIKIGNKNYQVELAPESIATLLVPAE